MSFLSSARMTSLVTSGVCCVEMRTVCTRCGAQWSLVFCCLATTTPTFCSRVALARLSPIFATTSKSMASTLESHQWHIQTCDLDHRHQHPTSHGLRAHLAQSLAIVVPM